MNQSTSHNYEVPDRPFRIHGLGELAIRCTNLPAMIEFYRDTIGLEVLNDQDFEDIVFFRVAEGVAGHTTVLALFRNKEDRSETEGAQRAGSDHLHHFALSLPWDEQELAIAWLRDRGIPFDIREFPWIGWRGVFLRDPEGNHVELVAGVPPSQA